MTNCERHPPVVRDGCRFAGRILLAIGVAVGVLSCTLPLVGEGILETLRRRPITAFAARAILPKLLLLAGATGLFVGALLVSTGALLRRAENAKAFSLGTQGAEEAPIQRANRLSAALILLLAAVFGATEVSLAGRSLTYDEIVAVEADVRTPLSRALETRAWINHISGSLLARMSRSTFGDTERGLRAAGVGLGIAGIASLGLCVVRSTRSTGAAVWLVVALGTNALVLHTSKQIRGYGPLMWFGAASVLWSCSLLRSRGGLSSRIRMSMALAGLFFIAMLLGLSHLFGLFYLSALTLLVHGCLLHAPRVTKEEALFAASLAGELILTLFIWIPAFPWLLYGTSTFPGGYALRRTLGEMSILFFGRPGMDLFATIVLCLITLAGIWLWRREVELRLLAIIGTVPLWTLITASLVMRPTFFFARFLLLGLVLGLTIVSIAFADVLRQCSGMGRKVLSTFVVATTAALLIPGVRELLSESRGYREVFEEVGNLLLSRDPSAEGRVVPAGTSDSRTIVRYYCPSALLVSGSGVRTSPEMRTVGKADVLAFVVFDNTQASPYEEGEKRTEIVPSWRAVVRGANYEPAVHLWGFGSRGSRPR